jgi:MFS family permease
MSEKGKKISLIAWVICMIGAIFYCYEYLLRIEPSVMVTDLMRQFGVAATGFGFIIATYYYAYTPMQLFVGILIDRYGTRLMIGLGIICCTIGSFLFSLSISVYLAAFSRMLIGFGSAFAFVGVLKLGAEWLPKQQFAFFVGLTTSLGMVGGMFGDIFLVHLKEGIGHQSVLHLGTLAGVILIPIIFIFVHDTPTSQKIPVRSTSNFKELFSGLKKMIQSPQMWIVGVIGNTLYLSLSAFAELWGIKFLQSVYHFSAKEASVVCSMVFLGWLVGAPMSGWISDLVGSRKKPLITGGLISALMIFIVVLKPFAISYVWLSIILFLFGLLSSAQVVCFAISRESNPHNQAATALAFTNFLVMVGGLMFQPFIGILLDLFWTGEMAEGVRVYSAMAYQIVFMIIPLTMVIGSLLGFKLKETIK